MSKTNTAPFFEITEDLLRVITAKELKPDEKGVWPIIYVKMPDNTFARMPIEPWTFTSEAALQKFREWLSNQSKEGRLFMRRDRAGEDFSSMYK